MTAQLIVAHPDTQHSVWAARGLRRAGMLRFLLTSVSLRRPRWLDPVLRGVAPGMRERLAQHRGHADFSAEELRVFPLHFLASRLGVQSWTVGKAWFGSHAGRLGVRERCGVLAFNTNALETFRMLKRAGLPCILDQSIARHRWANQAVQEERDAFPEWGESWSASEPCMDQEDEELALADLVLCGSRFCASTVAGAGVPEGRIGVAEYGTDTNVFSPSPDPRPDAPIRLLFVGTLTLRKGIHYLLEAVKRLERLGVHLTVVGSRSVRLEAFEPYSGMLDRLSFHLHDRMPDLYRAHDIYVFPSLVEGSSLSIYEALASGLPVITTPNAGSIVRDRVEGLIIPPRDVDALAGAIETLVRDPGLRVEMGQAARRRALECGDWRHYGERLVRCIVDRFPEMRS